MRADGRPDAEIPARYQGKHLTMAAPGGGGGGEPAVQIHGLTKRYRRMTALDDCSLTVPEGRISALVGPNGAGKTTLLRLLAGLTRPTRGSAAVFGREPGPDPDFLASVGYLAQESPLYRRLSAEDHIQAGARLNRRWDGAAARERLRALAVPLDRPVGRLSGGQRSQVGLTLALAKQPRLLLLDEPVAALDPLARRHFLGTLAAAAADAAGELTVLMSSHLIGELERVCDHVVLVTNARVRLGGDVADLLAEHRLLTGPRQDTRSLAAHEIVHATTTSRQSTLLIRLGGPVLDPAYLDPAYQVDDVSLEDLVLGYLSAAVHEHARLTVAGGDR